jgi:hypothetical protein
MFVSIDLNTVENTKPQYSKNIRQIYTLSNTKMFEKLFRLLAQNTFTARNVLVDLNTVELFQQNYTLSIDKM